LLSINCIPCFWTFCNRNYWISEKNEGTPVASAICIFFCSRLQWPSYSPFRPLNSANFISSWQGHPNGSRGGLPALFRAVGLHFGPRPQPNLSCFGRTTCNSSHGRSPGGSRSTMFTGCGKMNIIGHTWGHNMYKRCTCVVVVAHLASQPSFCAGNWKRRTPSTNTVHGSAVPPYRTKLHRCMTICATWIPWIRWESYIYTIYYIRVFWLTSFETWRGTLSLSLLVSRPFLFRTRRSIALQPSHGIQLFC